MPSSGVQTCARSEEHTSELQSHDNLVCRLLLEKTKITIKKTSVVAARHPRVVILDLSHSFFHRYDTAPAMHSSPTLRSSELLIFLFFLMIRGPPTSTLFPHTPPPD